MERLIPRGLHHVTAIARDADVNRAFYEGVLGLRLLEQTVNFDDPSALHLYYGDANGRPGTLITFFIWADRQTGRAGPGQVAAVRFAVGAESLPRWRARLRQHNVDVLETDDEPGVPALVFADPDGLPIALTADGRRDSDDEAIGGLHSVAIAVPPGRSETSTLLGRQLGLTETRTSAGRRRFAAGAVPGDGFVDVIEMHGSGGRVGVGSVHHVAFQVRDLDEQRAWRRRLIADGIEVTDIRDRRYFQSIYFEEPGGVRLEMATAGPGFVR
jgi:glyoxalase family protein